METSFDKRPMTTLAQCMNKLQEEGYRENFLVSEKGLHTSGSEKTYTPQEVKIANFYRFEGESDPSDSAILYALETRDGKKGMLSDAYGPYSDSKVSDFISQIEEISKRTEVRSEKPVL